jgi:hypothetical protein
MDNLYRLKAAVVSKTIEIESSIESGRPQSEILDLYKQLKELKYQILKIQVMEKPHPESQSNA